jgi:hypothetical protein
VREPGLAAPRHATLWAALVYAVAVATLAWPAFSGGFLVSPVSDQFKGGYAVREFGTAILKQTGHFPEWNPYLFGGMPYVGAMNGDIFYPPSLVLRLLLRPDVFVTWAFIIHIFLAGFFTYLMLRVMGSRFAGALVGGLAYMMGGPIASYVSPGHDGKLYVSALLPLALIFLKFGMRDGRRWAWPALALTVGFAILTPHPQLLQYMLLACGAYALYLAFWSGSAVTPAPRVAVRRLAAALGAVALGLAMGAAQFLPVAQYVSSSPRAGGARGYDFSASYSMPPEEMLDAYLPQFSGILENYWGRNIIHFHSDYIGVVVLVLVGCAFIGTQAARRRDIFFWLIVGFVATLWTLGGYTPFFHLVYALVPGTTFFRAPATIFFLAALAIAALAAEGVDNVLADKISIRYVIAWVAVGGAISLMAAGGALTTMSTIIAGPDASDRVAANAPFVTVGSLRSLVFVLLIGAVLVLRYRMRLSPRLAGWAIAALVVIDLWTIERLYWNFSPPASVVFGSNAAIDYVKREAQPARVLAVQLSPDAARGDPFLNYDALMVNRVRLMAGEHGNELRRYEALIGLDQGPRALFNGQLWRLLNVRFLLTNLTPLPLPGSQLVAGPVRDGVGTNLYLYRLPGDNPGAWVTPVSVKAGDEQTLATVLDQRFDPTLAAVYDTAAPVTGQHIDKLPPPLGITATATRYDPGHMTFHLDKPAPAGASLIVSENFFRGWSATVDGHPTAVGRADYTLIGVPLSAGATTVDLEFHSRADSVGLMVTFAAATLALLWLAAVAVLDRRRHG